MTLYKKLPLDQNQRERINYEQELLHYSIYMPKGNGFYWDIPWHWHEEFEFGFVQSGNLLYKTSREEFVLHAGDGIFLNSGVLHSLYALEPMEDIQFYSQFIDRIFLAGAYGNLFDMKYVTPVLEQKELEAVVFSKENEEEKEIGKAIWQAISLSKNQEPFYELRLRSLFSSIWERIYRCAKDCGGKKENYNDLEHDRLKHMMLFIRENYGERLTVPSIAEKVAISERECYRIFQKRLGMTPVDYVTSLRLEKAQELLRETKKSILEIALETGFGTSSYLGTKFKQYHHMTPREYRSFYAK